MQLVVIPQTQTATVPVAGRVKAARLPNLPRVLVQWLSWTITPGKFGSLAALTLPATVPLFSLPSASALCTACTRTARAPVHTHRVGQTYMFFAANTVYHT